MNGLAAVSTGSADLQLLLLLVAGHLLGDFLFQTRAMAAGKSRPGPLAAHVAVVAAAHLAALIPFLSWPILWAVLAVSVLHGAIDFVKATWKWPRPGRLVLFLSDQAAHLIVLAGAWLVLLGAAGTPEPLLAQEWLPLYVGGMVILAAFAFLWTGGSEIVSGTLGVLDLWGDEVGAGVPGGGRVIGILERTLTLILILFDQWATVALLLTAKSIARFEELKERRFSEYYLVGTLTSLLVAILMGLGLRALLG